MLTLFNSAFGMVLALALLLLAIVGPFLIVWIALSIRRDIHRIADFMDFESKYPSTAHGLRETKEHEHYEDTRRRIANSAFGR